MSLERLSEIELNDNLSTLSQEELKEKSRSSLDAVSRLKPEVKGSSKLWEEVWLPTTLAFELILETTYPKGIQD